MLEQRLPRYMWPRLGMCGLLYGLGERWYLRVEDRNDQFVQKIRRYANVFAKNEEKDLLEKHEVADSKGSPTETKATEKGGAQHKSKSMHCWKLLRQSVLGIDIEEHLDSHEVKCI